MKGQAFHWSNIPRTNDLELDQPEMELRELKGEQGLPALNWSLEDPGGLITSFCRLPSQNTNRAGLPDRFGLTLSLNSTRQMEIWLHGRLNQWMTAHIVDWYQVIIGCDLKLKEEQTVPRRISIKACQSGLEGKRNVQRGPQC